MNNSNNRCLIITDIHHRIVEAQRIIDKVPHDKLIFAGDIFDKFGDTLDEVKCVAEWYKKLLNKDNVVALLGNHDISYCYPANHHFACSGFTRNKSELINSILTREDWDKVKPFIIEQGWLISHAGLSLNKLKQLAPSLSPKNYTLENITAILEAKYNSYILNNELPYKYCHLFTCGWDRGGNDKHGGITWCDFSSLTPIRNIKQIVGHSILKFPCLQYYTDKQWGTLGESVYMDEANKIHFQHLPQKCLRPYGIINEGELGCALGLDTNNRHYGILEDNKLYVYDSTALK